MRANIIKPVLSISFSETIEQCGYLHDDNQELMDLVEDALDKASKGKTVSKADIRKMEEYVNGMKGTLEQILENLGDAKKVLK